MPQDKSFFEAAMRFFSKHSIDVGQVLVSLVLTIFYLQFLFVSYFYWNKLSNENQYHVFISWMVQFVAIFIPICIYICVFTRSKKNFIGKIQEFWNMKYWQLSVMLLVVSIFGVITPLSNYLTAYVDVIWFTSFFCWMTATMVVVTNTQVPPEDERFPANSGFPALTTVGLGLISVISGVFIGEQNPLIFTGINVFCWLVLISFSLKWKRDYYTRNKF